MRLLFGSRPVPAFKDGTVLTIGNFDGVHLGHQALLRQLKARAIQKKQPLVVILFEPQPGEYFRGDKAPARLSSLREKLAMLKRCQVDYVYCLRFNRTLASMSAQSFAENCIFAQFNASYLLLGDDFRFGCDRSGDVSLLKTLAFERGCEVETFPDFRLDDVRVSSTSIRQALASGDMSGASALSGRPWSMCGRVTYGHARGREWGVPTANLAVRRMALPAKGVFCVQVQLPDGRMFNGVANLGRRPTVDGSKNVLEVHLFDFDETLYGKLLQVHFLHKLRDEIRFASLEALIAQIHDDVATAKTWFDQTEKQNAE
ncbi:bifunctional riboflavin kinase/FAD synthetase [Legionella sp. CNM-4043-24]|uniref:bifunctional riboflavin kinase/FAD synthetase n=1 Tax=Legionella sp. CNM-4043-24 TaxID=3421646 RepID=UPI00403ADCA4